MAPHRRLSGTSWLLSLLLSLLLCGTALSGQSGTRKQVYTLGVGISVTRSQDGSKQTYRAQSILTATKDTIQAGSQGDGGGGSSSSSGVSSSSKHTGSQQHDTSSSSTSGPGRGGAAGSTARGSSSLASADLPPAAAAAADEQYVVRRPAGLGEVNILYYTRHFGTTLDFTYMASQLKLHWSQMLPTEYCPPYGMSAQQADECWRKVRFLCDTFDVIVVSDTTPDARPFLQNPCRAHIILQVRPGGGQGVGGGGLVWVGQGIGRWRTPVLTLHLSTRERLLLRMRRGPGWPRRCPGRRSAGCTSPLTTPPSPPAGARPQITNRFDWDVKDKEQYYSLMNETGRLNPRVYWVANNPLEVQHARRVGVIFPPERYKLLRPTGWSSLRGGCGAASCRRWAGRRAWPVAAAGAPPQQQPGR
jgi:hypothetical protein